MSGLTSIAMRCGGAQIVCRYLSYLECLLDLFSTDLAGSAVPPDGEQELEGWWEMESYTTRIREGGVDHEFQIRSEEFDGETLPWVVKKSRTY